MSRWDGDYSDLSDGTPGATDASNAKLVFLAVAVLLALAWLGLAVAGWPL